MANSKLDGGRTLFRNAELMTWVSHKNAHFLKKIFLRKHLTLQVRFVIVIMLLGRLAFQRL